MNKKSTNSKIILDLIRNNPGLSSTEIGKFLGMTVMTAFNHLTDLLNANLVYKTGKGKNTRYFYLDIDAKIDFNDLISNAILILEGEYEIIVAQEEIVNILEDNFCYISIKNGKFSYGLSAFISWCKDDKRNYGDNILPNQLARYIVNYFDTERLRRKSGFFDGTESMIRILSQYTQTALDKVLFCNISEISGFGRTRSAIELYYGKQNSDSFFLKHAIESSVDSIRNYIKKNSVDTVIFTPPTIARPTQFQDILREQLNLSQGEIIVTKIKSPDKTLIAQKYTKGEDRIINADASIQITNIDNISSILHILILDDNFTTGATINAIAKKLRFLGYNNKITAITITGKFHYDAIIDMDEV